MFKNESEMQELIHNCPEYVLSGIPEINPELCHDQPLMISLGREIYLNSGPIDNMYIDANGIITFIECKRYGDSRMKREVYSQAINYASDLQNMLAHYQGEDFLKEFYKIISTSMNPKFHNLEALVKKLRSDPLIQRKDKAQWEEQFLHRLEYNIKNSVVRIIILCGQSPSTSFAYSHVRNLIQIMSFSETKASNYDLILMDFRKFHDTYKSQIIWRKYASLPEVPLISSYVRDTSKGVQKITDLIEGLSNSKKVNLKAVINKLETLRLYADKTTNGYSIKWKDNKSSTYIMLVVEKNTWGIHRHQIRETEQLYFDIKSGKIPSPLKCYKHLFTERKSNKKGSNGHEYWINIKRRIQVISA